MPFVCVLNIAELKSGPYQSIQQSAIWPKVVLSTHYIPWAKNTQIQSYISNKSKTNLEIVGTVLRFA